MKNRLSYFNGRGLFIGFSTAAILRAANTNFLISEMIGFVLGLITIILIKRTNRYKLVRKFSGFIFTLLSIISIVHMSNTLYLQDTPEVVLGSFALLGVFIISFIGDKPFVRMVNILFMVAMPLFLISQFLLFKEANFDNILPLFNSSIVDTLWGAIIYYLAGVTPILSLNDEELENDKKDVIINYLMSSLTIMLSSLIIILVLGMKEAMIYRYPEYLVLKRIRISDFFTNVDNIFVLGVVIDIMLMASSGLKNMGLKNKFSKVVTFVLLLVISTYFAKSAGLMARLYNMIPIIMSFLLILTIIPKKKMNKQGEK